MVSIGLQRFMQLRRRVLVCIVSNLLAGSHTFTWTQWSQRPWKASLCPNCIKLYRCWIQLGGRQHWLVPSLLKAKGKWTRRRPVRLVKGIPATSEVKELLSHLSRCSSSQMDSDADPLPFRSTTDPVCVQMFFHKHFLLYNEFVMRPSQSEPVHQQRILSHKITLRLQPGWIWPKSRHAEAMTKDSCKGMNVMNTCNMHR